MEKACPVATTRHGEDVVVTNKLGRVKRYPFDRLTSLSEKDIIITKITNEYARCIMLLRRKIDTILAKRYRYIPKYRDCDVSDIGQLIKEKRDEEPFVIAGAILDLIKKKRNGNEKSSS